MARGGTVVNRSSEVLEFSEIPVEVREAADKELHALAMNLLHAEAVERGDLPPAPTPLFDTHLGAGVRLIFVFLCGGVTSLFAVATVLWFTRLLATL